MLMFADIPIRTLARAKTRKKLKLLPEQNLQWVKSTAQPLHYHPLLFYSSNERLMSHRFVNSKVMQPKVYPSQVNEGGGKICSNENLLAVQNRFIEAFVRSPPPLDVNDLPRSGRFGRIHGIFGTFDRVIDILQSREPADFFSPMLAHYVLNGLCNNVKEYNKLFGVDLCPTLQLLVKKYIPPQLQSSLL